MGRATKLTLSWSWQALDSFRGILPRFQRPLLRSGTFTAAAINKTTSAAQPAGWKMLLRNRRLRENFGPSPAGYARASVGKPFECVVMLCLGSLMLKPPKPEILKFTARERAETFINAYEQCV